MTNYLFKDRDGQTPLPSELFKGLKIKSVQTIGELDEQEEDNIAKGLAWLARQKSDPCRYDFWIKLHKKLFGNVWSWAGQIRTHELSNPDFKLPHQIWPELHELEKSLAFWITSDTYSPEELAARFHERIETIHPFANGNGRFGRIATEEICRYLKHKIPTWGNKFSNEPMKRRELYIEALTIARRNGDYTALIEFMFC